MLLDYFGILLMSIMGGARLYQILHGEWWALPLFAHAMISAFLLIIHRKPKSNSPTYQRLVAWASALISFAIHIDAAIPISVRFISLMGVGFAVWTLIALGKSFDVCPADRGLVNRGPYKLVRHPMYASELFSVIVIVSMDLSMRNIIVTSLLIITIILRIHWEEGMLQGYDGYTRQVPSRLLPGVW